MSDDLDGEIDLEGTLGGSALDPDDINSTMEQALSEEYGSKALEGDERREALSTHSHHLVRDTTSQLSLEPDTPEGMETTATIEVPDSYCFTCGEWVGLSGVDLSGQPRSRKDAYYLGGPPQEVQTARKDVRDGLADLVDSVASTVSHIDDADEALAFIETEREQAEERLAEVNDAA